jgi:hypothetical protein
VPNIVPSQRNVPEPPIAPPATTPPVPPRRQ